MDPMLEKFFAEHEQNLQARRQQHREEVLRSLKLVKPCDGKKYYVDAETVRNAPPSQRAFFSVEEADGGQRYYFTSGSGTAPIDVTDEEFARLEALLEEEKRYTPAPPKDGAAKPTPRDEGSTTQHYEVAFGPAREGSIWPRFFKVLAWVAWVGGLAVSIAVATLFGSFNFWTFLATAVGFALSGCISLAASMAFSVLDMAGQRLSSCTCSVRKKK